MDKRQKLARGSILAFEGMECRVEEAIGFGSDAIVYTGQHGDGSDDREKHRVLIKELFPCCAWGGIYRGADDRICIREGKPLAFFLMQRERFEACGRIHRRLLEKEPDLRVDVKTFEYNHTMYEVITPCAARTLEDMLYTSDGSMTLKRCVQLMLELLKGLAAYHGEGYLHLDICPQNMIVFGHEGREQIMLIGQHSGDVPNDEEELHWSFKQNYAAPELLLRMDSVCAATDLYSVAAVFYRCLMGRMLTLEEAIRSTPPDAADSPYLKEAAPPVCNGVKQILRRGLCVLAEDRYQSAEQMRKDFEKLSSRIY